MKKAAMAICALSVALGGCAWFKPKQAGPIRLARACFAAHPPRVAEFGENGVRGVYQFVIHDAIDDGDLGFLLRYTQQNDFNVLPVAINLNGRDTWVAVGPGVLRNQAQVDAEFEMACEVDRGRVYLTHVRYNDANEAGGPIRVR